MDGNQAITATITALAVMHSVPHSASPPSNFYLFHKAELRAAQQRNGEMRVKLQAANKIAQNLLASLRTSHPMRNKPLYALLQAESTNKAELEKMLEQAREELQEVRSSMHACEEQVQVKERNIINLKQEIGTRNSIQIMQLEESTSLGQTLTDVNKELDGIKKELAEATTKKQEAMTDNQRLLEELIRLDDHPEKLQQARDDLAESHTQGNQALAEEKQSTSFQVSSLQAENEQLKREIVDLLVSAEERKNSERVNMERMIGLEDEVTRLAGEAGCFEGLLQSKDFELLKLPALESSLKATIERYETTQKALEDIEEKRSLAEQTKVGMALQLEQKEFFNKQLQNTLEDTIHVGATTLRTQAKEHALYQFRRSIRRIWSDEARRVVREWRDTWCSGRLEEQKRIMISKNSELMSSHASHMKEFVHDKEDFKASLEKDLQKERFHVERLQEQLQLLREQLATRVGDKDTLLRTLRLRSRETMVRAAVCMMRQVARRLQDSAVIRRLDVWSFSARFDRARVEGLDRDVLRDANATMSLSVQQMEDTKVGNDDFVQKAAIRVTRQVVGRMRQRRAAVCLSRMRRGFHEYLLGCANELSMRQALDIERATFHNDQLSATLRDQAGVLKKEQDAVTRQGIFNQALQESLHENLEQSVLDKEAFEDTLVHEKLSTEKRSAMRLLRLNRNQLLQREIQTRLVAWRGKVAADRIRALGFEASSHKRQQEMYGLHASDLSDTLNARLAEIHDCQTTIAQLRQELASERSLNDIPRSHAQPNAEMQRKLDAIEIELAAVRSEANRTQKLLQLTKEDLFAAQSALTETAPASPAMGTFGQPREAEAVQSVLLLQKELAAAREQLARAEEEIQRKEGKLQVIKEELFAAQSRCMSTGSPNFGGTESVSRKAGAGNHQQDCVTCEELRDKIENLERNLSQMEHHSKTNARFVLQIETLHEENRKLTSDLASREAALIEQRTAKLRGDISPPGSTYKRTSASQARTKRPFEVPG